MYFLRSYQRSQSKEKDKVVAKVVNLNDGGGGSGGSSRRHDEPSTSSTKASQNPEPEQTPRTRPTTPSNDHAQTTNQKERSVPRDRPTSPSVVVLKVGSYGTGPADPYRRKSISVHESLYGGKRGSVSVAARPVSSPESLYGTSRGAPSDGGSSRGGTESADRRPLSPNSLLVPTIVQPGETDDAIGQNPMFEDHQALVYDTPGPLSRPTSPPNASSVSSSSTGRTGTTVVAARPLSPPDSFRNGLASTGGQETHNLPCHPPMDINRVLAPHGATPIGGTASSPPRTLLTSDGATCQLVLPQPADCGGQRVCDVLRYFDFRKVVSDDEDDYEPCMQDDEN